MDHIAFTNKYGPRLAQALVLTLATMYLCRAQVHFSFPEKPIMLSVFFLSFIDAFTTPIRAALLFMLVLAMVSPVLTNGGASFVKDLIP